MLDCTVVVGIDARTSQQLAIVMENWRTYRPEMFDMPWLCFFDNSQVHGPEAADFPSQTAFLPVSFPADQRSQRDRMLSAWATVPAGHVRTPYFMKIDTDVIAVERSEWLQPAWFDPDDYGFLPVIVAPKWGYTKGRGFLDRLEAWGDTVQGLKEHQRLNIPHDPHALRVRHPRFCSWVCYHRTDWARWAANLMVSSLGPLTAPVPSHDTSLWYIASRGGNGYRTINQKKLGWRNYSNMGTLRNEVAKLRIAD